MGVDCCGTVPATPPTNGLEQLDISDSSASNSGNDRKTNGNETIYQEDFSPSEFKVYNENRLNLFDQYKQRQDEKVCTIIPTCICLSECPKHQTNDISKGCRVFQCKT